MKRHKKKKEHSVNEYALNCAYYSSSTAGPALRAKLRQPTRPRQWLVETWDGAPPSGV